MWSDCATNCYCEICEIAVWLDLYLEARKLLGKEDTLFSKEICGVSLSHYNPEEKKIWTVTSKASSPCCPAFGSWADLRHDHSSPPYSCALLVGPDQWLRHPLMVWHHSIALISEQQAGLTHSRARLQTLRRLLSFHVESGVHMCDCMCVCVTEERKSERLNHRKYWLCYLLLLTSGAKAGKSIQKGSRMLCRAGFD